MLDEITCKKLKRKVINVMKNYGMKVKNDGTIEAFDLRQLQWQIAEKTNHKYAKLGKKYEKYIAGPQEMNIDKINPRLILVNTDRERELWQYATSFWSIPVTVGYGRRLRFLVFDEYNEKLIGILGLCDPVIGLGVRDKFIGWDREQKETKLYHMMSAYVLGTVPPYNLVLGSKLIALLCQSKDIVDIFKDKYNGKTTVIRGEVKPAKLAVIDTMGAFGKSAIYTRLKGWQFVGYTNGQSHLHLTVPEIWEIAKNILKEEEFKTYKFGQGPNWKLRMTRSALSQLGFNENLLNIGWQRGYYICPLAVNWKEYLLGQTEELIYITKSIEELRNYWYKKWVEPRKRQLTEKIMNSMARVGDLKSNLLV